MILLAFIVLLTAASMCLLLSQAVATRILGIIAGGATMSAGLVLLIENIRGRTISIPPVIWASMEEHTVYLTLHLHATSFMLALLLLGSSTLALVAIAMALAPTIRGFGTLFASMLLAIAAALLTLVSEGIILAFAWALMVIAGYSAAQMSGVYARSEQALPGITLGLLASLLLLSGMLAIQPALTDAVIPSTPSLVCIILACLMLTGSVLFQNTLDEFAEAPAAIGGLLYGIIVPIVALGTLVHFAWDIRMLPALADGAATFPSVSKVLLLVMGALSMVLCAAGALNEHHLRRVLAWQVGVQAGAVAIATGLDGPLAALAAPTLLLNVVLATLVGALVVAEVELATGHDDYTQGRADHMGTRYASMPTFKIPGLLWILAALSALGIPPFWGFWGRYWLVRAAAVQSPWVVPLIFAASGLAALAYLVPLARFWAGNLEAGKHIHTQASHHALATTATPSGMTTTLQRAGESTSHGRSAHATHYHTQSTTFQSAAAFLALLPLITLGVVPRLVWENWLRHIPNAPLKLPINPLMQVGMGVLVGVGMVLIALLWNMPWSRRTLSDEDMTDVVLAPDTLAKNVAYLAWIGRPGAATRRVWDGLMVVNHLIRAILTPFEQRYYLAGVLLALISLVVLMAQ